MTGQRAYILVEGQGEVEAAQNILVRITQALGRTIPWTKPRRWVNLHQWQAQARGGVEAGAEFVRGKPDAAALLILRDEDDDCPKEAAPGMAEKLRGLSLPFPTAYVLLRPEYEVLFLPCLETMGFPAWDRESWEARRGIKEWLSSQLPPGRSYKPSVDQLRLTRLIDLERLRSAQVPSFGSLERAVAFLADHWGRPGAVYPEGEAS